MATISHATKSINGFTLNYIPDDKLLDVFYNGNHLHDLVIQPKFYVNVYDPMQSVFEYDQAFVEFSDKVFDTIQMLNTEAEPCLAAFLASRFYELLGRLDTQFKFTGCHILCIPFWLSVLNLVQTWEERHSRVFLHIGTPLYFLSEAYLLTQNNDPAFIYLIKSIEDDIKLGKLCPFLNYPEKEPAYLTACLVDNPNDNQMYSFIVKPLRLFLEDAIIKYNTLFGKESRLKAGIADFDSRFLQKRDSKIEPIKFLFVLELLQLHRLRNIKYQTRIETSFSQMLRLNRLFSLTLCVDKLLHARYPPKITNRGRDPSMRECITSYANSHGIPQKNLDRLFNRMNLNSGDPETVLRKLLMKRNQKRFRIFKREMYPILISYKIRNTSAHKIHAAAVISSEFDDILQCLLEAIFTIVGQMPK